VFAWSKHKASCPKELLQAGFVLHGADKNILILCGKIIFFIRSKYFVFFFGYCIVLYCIVILKIKRHDKRL
jgi:hypothetical protein